MLYRFGDCEIDESRRQLRRGGREQRVQPKVLDLLLFLIRRAEVDVGPCHQVVSGYTELIRRPASDLSGYALNSYLEETDCI